MYKKNYDQNHLAFVYISQTHKHLLFVDYCDQYM